SAQMSINTNTMYKGFDRAFCIRMKSTLTKRGCHFKSSGYRVVLILCRLRAQYNFTHNKKSHPQIMGMVGIAVAMPPPSVHEIRLECDMFVTRINFDLTIAHCEPKVTDLLEYTPEELLGKSMYTLCHGEDTNKLKKSHQDLINKGQVLTHYYRIMNKNGGYTWIQTCATIICNSKNTDEQNIICVNYVISKKENANLILDTCQMEAVKVEDAESAKLEHSSESPGSGPSNEGGNRNNRNNDMKGYTTPKSPERRGRKPSTTDSNVPNTTNLNVNKDDVADTTVNAPASTRGRKRKIKPVVKEEKDEPINTKLTNMDMSSHVPSSTVLPIEQRTESS
ncbi:unnamed protein product, partial [Sphagnum compactum]